MSNAVEGVRKIMSRELTAEKDMELYEAVTARVTKDSRGSTLSLADESGTGIMLVVPVEKIKEML